MLPSKLDSNWQWPSRPTKFILQPRMSDWKKDLFENLISCKHLLDHSSLVLLLLPFLQNIDLSNAVERTMGGNALFCFVLWFANHLRLTFFLLFQICLNRVNIFYIIYGLSECIELLVYNTRHYHFKSQFLFLFDLRHTPWISILNT